MVWYYDLERSALEMFCSKHLLGWYCHPEYVCRVCNLSDYPTKVGFRIFCRILSDYEEYYAWSLSDFNISDPITLKQL